MANKTIKSKEDEERFFRKLSIHLKFVGIIKDSNISIYSEKVRRPTKKEISQYKKWCVDHNFTQSLDKTSSQRQKELLVVSRDKIPQTLKHRSGEKNQRRFFQMIFHGKIKEKDLNGIKGPYGTILKNFNESTLDGKKSLEDLIFALNDRTDILKHNYIDAIMRLSSQYKYWIRSPKNWKPKTHNAERQFVDLAKHLFAKYEMPQFMAKVWLENNANHWEWYKHIGRGENIRTANIPVALTKKMAHGFMQSPKDYNLSEAFRWGQVYGLDGNKKVMEGLRQTRLCQGYYDHDDFWITVIRYFIRHSMLDTMHYNPIVDYVYHTKYVSRTREDDNGVIVRLGPEQPNLTMKDRNPETLIAQVEKWHEALSREKKIRHCQWEPSTIGDFCLEEGNVEKGNLRTWRIRELLNAQDLQEEGREMHHCVGSYVNSCASGSVAVFSMSKESYGNMAKKHLTISVRLSTKTIVEARGRFNARPEAKELNILYSWAKDANLKIPNYIC
jgi:hypothetical protein